MTEDLATHCFQESIMSITKSFELQLTEDSTKKSLPNDSYQNL